MIDTVRFQSLLEIQPHVFNQSLPGWYRSSNDDGDTPNTNRKRAFVLRHKRTGLKVEIDRIQSESIFAKKRKAEYRVGTVEASLPKILFGTNSKLITSDQQIKTALKDVDAIVRTIAHPLPRIGPERKFIRVDLCWQIRGHPLDFIRSHENLKHPEIDKWPSIYHRNQTILWPGSEMSISFYDKTKEREGNRGNIVRIEVKLLYGKLRRELADGKFVDQLNVAKCYSVLRNKILSFTPKTVMQFSGKSALPSKWQIYYLAVSQKWKLHGQPAINYFLQNYSDKKRARQMIQLASAQLRSYRINWRKELPSKMPRVHTAGDFQYSITSPHPP